MNQQSYFMLTCVSLFMFFYSLCSTSARSLQISRISPCQQIFQEAVPRYKILCTVPILVVKSYLPLTTPHHLDSVLVDVMTCGCFGIVTPCSHRLEPSPEQIWTWWDIFVKGRGFPLLYCFRMCFPLQCLKMDGNGPLVWFWLKIVHLISIWDWSFI